MPAFIYQARDQSNRLVEGRVEAESDRIAIATLGARGVFPVSLREASTVTAPPQRFRLTRRKIRRRDVTLLTRQLADLLGAGLPLLNALSLLEHQLTHHALCNVVADVAEQIRAGRSLSEAISQHPSVFSPLYLNLVSAGELGGTLEQVLARLADAGEAEDELVGKITTALAYPLLILAVGVATVAVLLTFVIPKLVVLFDEMGQLLPLPTRLLLAISQGTVQYGWLLVVGGVILAVWWRQARRTAQGQLLLDRLLQRVPLVGALVHHVELARMARSLGMLIGHGAPLLASLEVVSRGTRRLLQRAIETVREAVAQGSSLANAMSRESLFPPFVVSMVAIGEEGGTLEHALDKVATTYEKTADRTTRLFTTLLEPVLILTVGLIVGFIVIAMLLPIFNIGLLAG